MKINKTSKIAYIVSMINGFEPFIYREVDELYKKGLKIVLFATKFKGNDIYSPKKEWEYYRFQILKVILLFPFLFIMSPLRNLFILLEAFKYSTLSDFMIALYYARIMKRIGIKKIHCHFGDRKLFIGYFCKRILNLPLSVTIHAHEFITNPNFKMFRHALKLCDLVIAVSEQNRTILEKEYSVPSEKIKVVKLFIDQGKYDYGDKKRILWVGRFVSEKRFDILLESIKLLNRDDVQLVIVGFGPENPTEIAKEKGIADKVLVFDKMDQRQLGFFYYKCDIFCLSSEREGIPVVLMEAMAAGMPVVSTDVGAVKELVKDGILVKPNDPMALAKGLNMLLDNPELRKSMGEKNRKIVEVLHSKKNLDALYDILTAE
jgi:colanic acid/amylovoran biosynthesis glycosyltransferase